MKILLVDDHAVVRQGIRQLLERFPGAVVIEAATLSEAEKACEEQAPDIVVLDVNLQGENGLLIAKRFARRHEPPRIIAFSMHSEPAYVREAFDSGVIGYVTKTSKPEELVAAVSRAMSGGQYIDSAITMRMAEGAIAPNYEGLSGRESEILALIGDGRSMAEIAAVLGIAYKTVANTSLRLRDKLGAKSSADLVRIAIEAAASRRGQS